MSETTYLLCGDCKSSIEARLEKRGSALVEAFLKLFLIVPGMIYARWRKDKMKKQCDYCSSSFLIPDTPANRNMLNIK